MSPDPIDYEAVRARVEKRLEPRMRLLRRRAWLFAHILIFVAVMLLIYNTGHDGSLFFFSTSHSVPENSFTDIATGAPVIIPGYTYLEWQPYALVSLLSFGWLLLVILHALNVWMAFGRERVIQREMDREMELEKMRLQLELAQAGSAGAIDGESEKPKRGTVLADDGELSFENETVRRDMNRSRS